MTQLVRIEPGHTVEEAHMRNRQLIARWVLEQGKTDKVVEMVVREGKTYVRINDYLHLRILFGRLLAEVQRIKSEGDYEAARLLVEIVWSTGRPRFSMPRCYAVTNVCTWLLTKVLSIPFIPYRPMPKAR